VGGASAQGSRWSGAEITSSRSAASAAVRVIGPTWDSVPNGLAGYSGTLAYVGLCPVMPQNAAGMRTEPPPSVPRLPAPMPSATATALPPLDPRRSARAATGCR